VLCEVASSGQHDTGSFADDENTTVHQEAAFGSSSGEYDSHRRDGMFGLGSGMHNVPAPSHSVFSTTRAYSSWFRPMVRGGD
jgi:hypothetical protein